MFAVNAKLLVERFNWMIRRIAFRRSEN